MDSDVGEPLAVGAMENRSQSTEPEPSGLAERGREKFLEHNREISNLSLQPLEG